MPYYIKGNKLFNNKILRKNLTIDKNVITSHINLSTTNRLIGKDPSVSMNVYSSQNPYGGVNDAGTWVRNPNCWINGVSNISCFSPAQRSGANWWQRAGTLITRKHVLFVDHFVTSILPNGGTPLIFVDENNNAIKRNIIQYAFDSTNIAIALLDNEVPSNIKIAKVLPVNFVDYVNTLPFLGWNNPTLIDIQGFWLKDSFLYSVCLDQEEKASVKLWIGSSRGGPLNDISGGAQFYRYSNYSYGSNIIPNPLASPMIDNLLSWDEPIEAGDSGNPAFIIIDNELVVLTTWSSINLGTFISSRYNQVNNLIESLSPGQGYSLTPVDLAAVYNKYAY